jgi:receptor protein-tyrosine kinase
MGMLAPDDGETLIAEEFRRIKRPLLNNAFGTNASLVESGNLIMITSAIPNEGKTFVSTSLAVSIAMELDKTVLLVDTDVMKESATNLFHTETDLGLIDAIVDPNVSLGDIIISTDVPKLGLIPAGQLRGKATELLASDRMRDITEELAKRYDDRVILFDSPPLLATSEAGVLASLVGQIVMVIESGKTTQRQMADALTMLDQNKPIGLLLNKTKTSGGSGYYYGYYQDQDK